MRKLLAVGFWLLVIFLVVLTTPFPSFAACRGTVTSTTGSVIKITVDGTVKLVPPMGTNRYYFAGITDQHGQWVVETGGQEVSRDNEILYFELDIAGLADGTYNLIVRPRVVGERDCLNEPIEISGGAPSLPGTIDFYFICKDPKTGEYNENCKKCIDAGNSWTALGCVATDPAGFVDFALRFIIGIGGGIAFLIMVFGAIKILSSQGNPEGIQGGKDMITSAIAGILFIVFSVIILRIIGYDILRIPGIVP